MPIFPSCLLAVMEQIHICSCFSPTYNCIIPYISHIFPYLFSFQAILKFQRPSSLGLLTYHGLPIRLDISFVFFICFLMLTLLSLVCCRKLQTWKSVPVRFVNENNLRYKKDFNIDSVLTKQKWISTQVTMYVYIYVKIWNILLNSFSLLLETSPNITKCLMVILLFILKKYLIINSALDNKLNLLLPFGPLELS